MIAQSLPLSYNKRSLRIAVSVMFFFAGLIFASWGSRIANIQQHFGLSKTALGGVLLAIPVGLMASLPVSGWVITKIGSKRLAITALTIYGLILSAIGAAPGIPLLITCLVAFGFASNAANIAVNTQAVTVEREYGRPILASFHGVWSLAGFAGAGIGTLMIGLNINPQNHFIIIFFLTLAGILIAYRYLADDNNPVNDSPAFAIPDRSLIKLGIIAFCSLICEGAMFDWSVIYFREIIHARGAVMGIGYTAFMCTMATGRFFADWFSHRFGLKFTLQMSGTLTAVGLLIAVLFPYLFTAIAGFMLVGFGVSSVVPMVYSAAGKSTTMSPGVALAAVSTIGFAGFLAGPPVIGFLAGAFNLRVSFTLIAVMGMCVAGISTKAKL